MKLYCPECQSVYEDISMTQCPEDDAKLFMLEATVVDPLIDAVIDGRFKIESKLGMGGMGAVYAGVQLSVGRRVAVKVLRDELMDRELALERFYRESKIISELTHPNIVRLVDFGQDRERDLLYLVMELVDGLNLGDMLERGRFKIAMALELVYQVCGALTEPHARGVIHRDLKPDNLLVVPISDGTIQVKVLDFGIARALEGNAQLTATGMVCGTPQYMAPEQAQNQAIGPSTDLYALGVILYEMLSGAPPFHGQNSLQVMLQQIQRTPEPLAGMLPPGALPPEVEDLVNDMLAKNADARPQSARAVRDSIDAIRRAYDLPPVRLAADLEREASFDPWMLPSLPKPNMPGAPKPGTEALRRETGLERAPHRNTNEGELALSDTLGEFEGPLTAPLPAEQRVHIYADRRRDPSDSGPSHAPPRPPPQPARPDRTESLELRSAPASTSPNVAAPLTSPHMPPAAPSRSKGPLIGLLAIVGFCIIAASVAVAAIMLTDKGEGGETDEPITALDPLDDPTAQDDPTVVDDPIVQDDPIVPEDPGAKDDPIAPDTPEVEPKTDPVKTGVGSVKADSDTPRKTTRVKKTHKTSKVTKKDPVKKDPVKKDPVVVKDPDPPAKDPVVVKDPDPPKAEKKDPEPKKSFRDKLKEARDDKANKKKLGDMFGEQ